MSALVLYRHHLRMLARPWRLLLTTLLAALPALIVFITGTADPGLASEVPGIVAGVGAATFPIAALILSSATLRDERDDGTLPYLYLSPVTRPAMAAASIAAGVTVTGLVGLVSAAGVTAAGVAVGAEASVGWAAVPAYLVAAFGYAPLFVPAGYLVPRVILVGLGYVILWEQIVARLVTGVANTSVWRFAMSVYADLVGSTGPDLSDALGPVSPGTGGGVAKALVVVALGWTLLVWALRRRDAI